MQLKGLQALGFVSNVAAFLRLAVFILPSNVVQTGGQQHHGGMLFDGQNQPGWVAVLQGVLYLKSHFKPFRISKTNGVANGWTNGDICFGALFVFMVAFDQTPAPVDRYIDKGFDVRDEERKECCYTNM